MHTNYLHLIKNNLLILQGKRGIEKQPFQLPDFIAATGIEKIRQVMQSCICYHSVCGHPQEESNIPRELGLCNLLTKLI